MPLPLSIDARDPEVAVGAMVEEISEDKREGGGVGESFVDVDEGGS